MRRSILDFSKDLRFTGFVLEAGKAGLERKLAGISRVETAPSAAEGFDDSLLICSHFSPPEGVAAWLKTAAEKGLSALCLVRSSQALRRQVAAQAELCGLPFFTVEEEPVSKEFLSDFAAFLWNVQLSEQPPAAPDFTGLLFNLPTTAALLSAVEEKLALSVAYRDLKLCRTICASRDIAFTEKVKTYPQLELQRIFPYQWILNDGEPCGCLFYERPLSKAEGQVMNSAAIALRALLKKEGGERAARRRLMANFFTALLAGSVTDQKVLAERLHAAGFHRDYQTVVLCMKAASRNVFIDERTPLRLFESIEKKIASCFESAFALAANGLLYCVITLQQSQRGEKIDERVKLALPLCHKELEEYDAKGFYIGCGMLRESLIELRESAEEARKSALFAEIEELKRCPVFWEEITDFHLICSAAEAADAKKFHWEILGRIIKHDLKHENGLMETLEALEKTNWNVRLTAERLRFHPNTIKYRVRKILELLEAEPEDSAFKFRLSLAVRLHGIYRATHEKFVGDEINDRS